MRGLFYLRSSRPLIWLALSALLCSYPLPAFAEPPGLSTAPASAAVPLQPSPPATAPAPAVVRPPASAVPLPPEELGDLLMVQGRYVAAIDAYQKIAPPSAVVWNKIGMAYHHLSALDQARDAYQKAIKLDPHYAAALNNLAAVYHGKQDYNRAIRTYKSALKYSPKAAVTAVTYANLGASYFAEGKYKQGLKAYQKAIELDPNVFNAGDRKTVEATSPRQQLVAMHYYLAKTCAMAGKQQQALVYLRQAFGEGFNDRKRLEEDPGFDRLRTTVEFQQLLAEQRQRH